MSVVVEAAALLNPAQKRLDTTRSNLSNAARLPFNTSLDWLLTDSPDEAPYGNYIDSIGCDPNGDIRRSTVIGSHNLQEYESVNRVFAAGQGVMRFARFPERSTAVASALSQAWIGCQFGTDYERLIARHHNVIGGDGTPITDPAWDFAGLETANPGIRAKILAITEAATSADSFANDTFGRDTLNNALKASQTSAYAYKAFGHTLVGVDSIAAGARAGYDMIFALTTSLFGVRAGATVQESEKFLAAGTNAANGVITAENSVVLGPDAVSDGVWQNLLGSIIVGKGAGNGITPYEKAFIVHAEGLDPVFMGDMDNQTLGLWVPVNKAVKGRLHVYQSDSGQAAPNSSADHIVLESATNSGLSILSGLTGQGSIKFGDSASAIQAAIDYAHSTGIMTITTPSGIATASTLTLDKSSSTKALIASRAGVERGGLHVTTTALQVYGATGNNVGFAVPNGTLKAYVDGVGATYAWLPGGNNAQDIGSSSLEWANAYLGTALYVGANKVIGARDTGWTAMTGTPDKAASYDVSTVTLAQLAARVAALQAAFTTHGLIGA